MDVTRLYLIRHGQSADNAEGRFGGHSATPLSELGKNQASLTAKALSKENLEVVYSSDLLRAIQTAEPIAKLLNLEINATADFRERDIGVLEGLTFAEAKQSHPKDFYALVNREVAHVITRGESYRQLLDRTSDALKKIKRKHHGQNVAIIAHTGTISFMTLQIIGAIHRRSFKTPWMVTANCGINRFEFRSQNNVRVLSINDTRHLSEIAT